MAYHSNNMIRILRRGASRRSSALGFTLIELLVVMAIIATLLAVVAPRYFRATDDAREAALRADLLALREAIDHFHADRGVYPETLADLVARGYMRGIPVDPLTGSAETWRVLPPPERHIDEPETGTPFEPVPLAGKAPLTTLPDETGVYDVRSGAEGRTKNGVAFENL